MNECKIVEDLLPLYAEELVSEESADFIRHHAAHCDRCATLLERTTQPIQQLPEDSETMKKGLRRASRKMVVRGLVYYLLIAGLFIGGFFYFLWECGIFPVEQVFVSADGRSKIEFVDWDNAGFFNTGAGVIVNASVPPVGMTGYENWEKVDGCWSPDGVDFLAQVDLTEGGKGVFLLIGKEDIPFGWRYGREEQGLITVLTRLCKANPEFPTGWEAVDFSFHAWTDDSETITFIYETDNGQRGFVDYHYPTETITAVD